MAGFGTSKLSPEVAAYSKAVQKAGPPLSSEEGLPFPLTASNPDSQILCKKQKSEPISHREDQVRISISWSEWRDSNSRPPAPKAGALPTAQHPGGRV